MNTFYFNTGVRPENNPHLFEGEMWVGGVKVIPFDTDAPKGSILLFLCNNPDLPEKTRPNVIVREIFNTRMTSKYAYMLTPIG